MVKQVTYKTAFADAFQLVEVDSQVWTLDKLIPLPRCQACNGSSQKQPSRGSWITHEDAQADLRGMVAFLPAKRLVPAESTVHQHHHVNDGAFRHPCVILQQSLCRHLVFCAPVTSFGNTSLAEKYELASQATKDNVFSRYLALNHDARTKRHSDLDLLDIDGDALEKQSYMHLDCGFWIEWENLSQFRQGRTYLSRRSLSYAQWAYTVAENHRQAHGIPSGTTGSCTPPRSRTPSPPRDCHKQPLEWRRTSPSSPPSAFGRTRLDQIVAATSWR